MAKEALDYGHGDLCAGKEAGEGVAAGVEAKVGGILDSGGGENFLQGLVDGGVPAHAGKGFWRRVAVEYSERLAGEEG